MTWTAPEITRVNRPLAEPTGDERALADAWLDFHQPARRPHPACSATSSSLLGDLIQPQAPDQP
jgi:hypothetical protein